MDDELTRQAVELIRDVYPDAVQTVDGKDIGFGAGRGYKGLVFVVTPVKDAVRIGVAGGASLPDPDGLLTGAGKVHRHLKVTSAADLERPELRALLESAVAKAGAR